MPYINFYLENLDQKKHEVHVLYWNRDLKEEDVGDSNCIFHEFKFYQKDEISKISKIKNFLKYRKFALKLIDEENFDYIIVLHSIPGVYIS